MPTLDRRRSVWPTLGLDATRPWGREAEFARKTIPGADSLRVEDYWRG